jgi:hypothetical protein
MLTQTMVLETKEKHPNFYQFVHLGIKNQEKLNSLEYREASLESLNFDSLTSTASQSSHLLILCRFCELPGRVLQLTVAYRQIQSFLSTKNLYCALEALTLSLRD